MKAEVELTTYIHKYIMLCINEVLSKRRALTLRCYCTFYKHDGMISIKFKKVPVRKASGYFDDLNGLNTQTFARILIYGFDSVNYRLTLK